MGQNPGTCESCHTDVEERVQTVTGRLVCRPCADTVLGAAAAQIAGGGVGESVATGLLFSRWRARKRKSGS